MNTTTTITTTPIKKITLSYTLKIRLTYAEFVEFANKHRDHEDWTLDDDDALELWEDFVAKMKADKNTLPSGRDVYINEEPDHETTYILGDIVEELISKQEDDNEVK